MGFSLKSITKGLTKAADVAFNPSTWLSTAKDVFSNESYGGLAQTGLEALGTYFQMPGLGTAIGGMLGGSKNAQGQPYGWSDILNAGLSGYNAQRNAKEIREQELDDYERFYGDNLALADKQTASAKDLASWNTIWGRENAAQGQQWTRENMEQANQMNQANAREQMQWQQWMSSTAHQRETTDLRNAGLNPILSGTGGMGASASGGAAGSVGTPSGPVASAGQAQVTQLGNIVTSAFGAMRAMAEATNKTASTTYLNTAQTALTKAQTTTESSKQAVAETAARLNKDQSLKISTEVENLKELRKNISKTGQLTDAQRAQVEQTTENLKQVFRDLKVKGDISEQDQNYWNNLIDQSGGSAQGTLQLLNSLRSLIK